MSKNKKSCTGQHGITPKITESQNYIGNDPLAGWFYLQKSSCISYKQNTDDKKEHGDAN